MKKIYLTLASILLVSLLASAQTRIYTPALRAPANDATTQMPDVTLDWDAVTGQGETINYSVQLAQNADFSDATTFGPTIFTAFKMSELNFDEVYFWRVKATDGTLTSEWSAPFNFRVTSTVNITSPNNQSTQNPDPLVKWNPITGITNYDVQIDTAYSWSADFSGVTEQLNDVYLSDATTVWAVGNAGIILKKTANQWETVTSPTSQNLLDVYFVDNNNGWAVGAAGTILYYNGAEWTTQTSGTSNDLNAVYFTSATNGYAVGKAGAALHFDGTTWSTINTGITLEIFAIHGLDENHIWATGKSGNISFFDGSTWTKSIIVNRDMLGIWALAPDKVYTSAKAGRVYYYDGNTWTEQASGSIRDLNDICFIDENNGYAVGAQGTLVYFNGSIWGSIASTSTKALLGINFFDETSGYFVGADGVIVKFQGEGFNSPYLKTFSLGADVTEFQFSNLAFGKNHYVRMRARHSADTSGWASPRSFIVVAKPTLSNPANNATNIALDTLAKWDALTGVVRYTVQIADNIDFENPFTSEVGTNTYRFRDLGYGQTYFWRVNTRHAGGVSEWSDTFKFTTIDMVELTTPAPNATDVSRLPLYSWVHIRGTEKYLVEVSKTSDFTDFHDYLTTGNTYQTQFLLDPNQLYFWRVKAIQGLDSTGWSAPRSYTTTNESAINDFEATRFSVHPNPSNGLVNLTSVRAANKMNVQVFTLVGKKVYESTYEQLKAEQVTRLDLRHLDAGIYLIRLSDEMGNTTRKLIIE